MRVDMIRIQILHAKVLAKPPQYLAIVLVVLGSRFERDIVIRHDVKNGGARVCRSHAHSIRHVDLVLMNVLKTHHGYGDDHGHNHDNKRRDYPRFD